MANINKNEIGYNENTTANALMVQYKRGLAAPMDISEVFTSLESAQLYASSDPIAYAGQSIAVAGDGIKTEIYKITSGGTLVRLVDEDALTNINKTIEDNEKVTAAAFNELNNRIDEVENKPLIIEITYLELKNLRINSQLIPGQQYRIIDYITTTVQNDTRSAGHQFDIIVTADDNKTLNHKARAIEHDFGFELKDSYTVKDLENNNNFFTLRLNRYDEPIKCIEGGFAYGSLSGFKEHFSLSPTKPVYTTTVKYGTSGQIDITVRLDGNSVIISSSENYEYLESFINNITNNTSTGYFYFDTYYTTDDFKIQYNIGNEDDSPEYFKNQDLNAWELWYDIDNDTDKYEWVNNYYDVEFTPLGDGDNFTIQLNTKDINTKTEAMQWQGESYVWLTNDWNNGGEYLVKETDIKNLSLDSYLVLKHINGGYYDNAFFGYATNPKTVSSIIRNTTNTFTVYFIDGTNADLNTDNKISILNDYYYNDYYPLNAGNLMVASGNWIYSSIGEEYYEIIPNIYYNIFTGQDYESVEITDSNITKGVIYRMIDERGNDCPYDFKNIQFTHPNDTIVNDYYYTFTDIDGTNITDKSIIGTCYNNRIMELIDDTARKNKLNFNVFINSPDDYCFCNTMKHNCYRNVFHTGCYKNQLSDNCRLITLSGNCDSNTFMYNCYNIILNNNSLSNIFNSNCNNIEVRVDYFAYNTFEQNVHNINIAEVAGGSERNLIQYYRFIKGTTYPDNEINNMVRNKSYETIISLNTNGDIKQFCLADDLEKIKQQLNID